MNLKNTFKIVLVSIPIVMIGWHFYASTFQHLTKWKGSGYAMYTNSHPDYRSIVFKLKDSDTLQQVYPMEEETLNQLPDKDQKLYRRSFKTLRLAAFYPERYEAALLVDKWTQRFSTEQGELYLYRTDLDIDKKEVRSVKMFTYE
ncbi:MAG: hypothetical protein ACI9WL_001046 [Rubritalea sp.]